MQVQRDANMNPKAEPVPTSTAVAQQYFQRQQAGWGGGGGEAGGGWQWVLMFSVLPIPK